MTQHPGDTGLAGLLTDPAAHLDAPDPALRRIAVAACVRLVDEPEVRARIETMLTSDPEARVRAEAAETLGASDAASIDALIAGTEDPDGRVVEAAATALGEVGSSEALPWLEQAARSHPDRLVREAAVAAVGAIGDPGSVPVILEVLRTGPPQVRRRAVVALSVFDDPAVAAGLRAAASDRNPMVREVASALVDRPG